VHPVDLRVIKEPEVVVGESGHFLVRQVEDPDSNTRPSSSALSTMARLLNCNQYADDRAALWLV
jgi:hypothetical protein